MSCGNCLGISVEGVQHGKLNWSCHACSQVSIFDLLTKIFAPKLNNIESEIQKLKLIPQFKESDVRNSSESGPSYSQMVKTLVVTSNSARAMFERRPSSRRGSLSSETGYVQKRKKN